MLNLDLMQSRAGREIYQMGQIEAEQRGKQAGLAEGKQAGLIEGEQKGERLIVTRLLEKRFGKLPVTLQARLEQATLVELEQWSVDLLTATCFEDIFKTQ